MSAFYMILDRGATADVSDKWVSEARRDGRICSGCGFVRRDSPLGPIDVDWISRSASSVCSFALDRQIYSTDLIELLSKHANSKPELSEIWKHGKLVTSHAVPWFGPEVAVRGSADSTLRRCKVCSRLSDYPVPPRYVLSGSNAGREVFSTTFGAVAVSERVRDLIRAQKFTGLSFERLEVLEKPVDGFAELDFDKIYTRLPRRKKPAPLEKAGLHDPYFLVHGDAWEIAEIRDLWVARAMRDDRICPDCERVSSVKPLGPVEVESMPNDSDSFGFLGFEGHAYGQELVTTLAENSKHEPLLSPVVWDGELVASHVVPTFAPIVPLRGTVKSKLKLCPECGRLSLKVESPHYLLSGDIAGREVVTTRLGSVAISKRLRDLIRVRGYRNLQFEPVDVRDEPVDGYGELDFEKRHEKLPRRNRRRA